MAEQEPVKAFVSYNWDTEIKTGIADELEKVFQQNGVVLLRDKNQLGNYDSIKKFMDGLSQGSHIITVIGEAYLKSENCMYELLRIAENGDFANRTRAIIADDMRLNDPLLQSKYIRYWHDKAEAVRESIAGLPETAVAKLQERVDLYRKFSENIAGFLTFISDRLTPSPLELRKQNYRQLFENFINLPEQTVTDSPSSANNNSQAPGKKTEAAKFLQPSDRQHQRRLAKKLLNACLPFYEALRCDFRDNFPTADPPNTSDEMVDFLADCGPELVPELFMWVRLGLDGLAATKPPAGEQKAGIEAAAALYCLAAILLVDREASRHGDYVIRVPRSESIICAIIATALFGGELRLLVDEQPELPRPEYVFEVMVPNAGELILESFERAMFTAIFSKNRQVNLAELDSKPLTKEEKANLAARIRTIKHKRKAALALVIRSEIVDQATFQPVAERHKIPVMFPSSEAAIVLLGMQPEDLLAEIREFWGEIDKLRDVKNPPEPSARIGEHYRMPPTPGGASLA